MKKTLFFCLTVFVGAIAGSFVALSFTSPTYAAAAQASEPTQYKIGVVNRKEVYDKYNRQINDMKALEARKDELQAQIDKLVDEVKAKRDKYNAMAEGEREQLGRQIEMDMADLQAEMQKHQRTIDVETSTFLQNIMADIDKAVTAIGNEGNYHLIFEADPKVSPVIYHSNTVDITSVVLARLNGGK